MEIGGLSAANQSWKQVNLAVLWYWCEEGATVNGAVNRDSDAAVENRPQLRIMFAQLCEQLPHLTPEAAVREAGAKMREGS